LEGLAAECREAAGQVAPGENGGKESLLKPEDLVQKLQHVLGPKVRSVILYGSAAAGDHVGKRSDYNILVVVDNLGIQELTVLSKPSAAWRKAGNPSPLFFTLDRLQKSADVFPIEVLDIKEAHKILMGEDVLAQVEVHRENLRLVIERELKSSLIRLREDFLLTEGKPRRVVEMVIESLSTILVLFRAALRLYQAEVPIRKIDAMKELTKHIQFDESVFLTIEDLKEGRQRSKDLDPLELFDRYLRTVESVVDVVDAHVHR
jgi:predicted nucleotidyltransferase